MNDERLIAFERLLNIMDKVRANCPWDKKQTFESLRYLTIEETYELSDAIIDKKYDDVAKELGDLMLHIVFYSKIAEEKNLFSITDVLSSINEKLIRRHPHIFGDVKVSSSEEVIKRGESFGVRWYSYFIARYGESTSHSRKSSRYRLRLGKYGAGIRKSKRGDY